MKYFKVNKFVSLTCTLVRLIHMHFYIYLKGSIPTQVNAWKVAREADIDRDNFSKVLAAICNFTNTELFQVCFFRVFLENQYFILKKKKVYFKTHFLCFFYKFWEILLGLISSFLKAVSVKNSR